MALIQCPTCEARVEATVQATCEAPVSDEERVSYQELYQEAAAEGRCNMDDFDPESQAGIYALLSCPVCKGVILGYRFDFEGDDSYARIWPDVRRRHHDLPRPIGESFDEALQCQAARAFLACALMCRRVLEAVCRHHYPEIRPLSFALKRLHDEGVIDKRLFEWAEALRNAGNLSAHEPLARVTLDDAADLVDFTEAILNYVFVLSAKYERFIKRREHAPDIEQPDDRGEP